MNPANKYLEAASRARYHSADGFLDADTINGNRGFYADATAAATAAPVAAAAPAATPGNKPTSQPFVVVVTSTSGAAVSNFDVLGAYEYLVNPPTGWSWSNGNLVNGSITISSGVSTINYTRMLAQFQTLPFTVGTVYINSSTATQINQALTLTVSDATGRTASNPMLPVTDPYQFSSTSIAFTQKFRMDGNTKITVAQILANAVVTFYFYPTDDFNSVRALSNGQVVKSFGNPNIVRTQQVFLASQNS